jgi:GR25 family glycosyltransferase involved in LPS biosynthesis/membrane-associated phospholipid phosphatase
MPTFFEGPISAALHTLNVDWFHAIAAGLTPDEPLLSLASALASGSSLACILMLVWTAWRRAPQRICVIGILAATGVTSVISQGMAGALEVPRPFMVGLSPLYIDHGSRGGLPSTHASTMFAAALLLLHRPALRNLGWAFLGIALLTGWARIYVGVHFPLDIAAGALLGASVATAWIVASRIGMKTWLRRGGEARAAASRPLKFELSELQILVINLDRSAVRLAAIRKRLKQAGLPWSRLPGIDGRALDLSLCTDMHEFFGHWRRRKQVNPHELGRCLSHVKALRQFLAGRSRWILVLEDDADFPDDLRALLLSLIGAEAKWDIIRLSGDRLRANLCTEAITQPYRLTMPNSRHTKAKAILLNRKAAEVLLKHTKPMSQPYDDALQRAWLFRLRLRVVAFQDFPTGKVVDLRNFQQNTVTQVPFFLALLVAIRGRQGEDRPTTESGFMGHKVRARDGVEDDERYARSNKHARFATSRSANSGSRASHFVYLQTK